LPWIVAVLSLLTSATTAAAACASTSTCPAASTCESTIAALAPPGCSPPNALASNGSPSNASKVFTSTFCDSQPMLLNASVTPMS